MEMKIERSRRKTLSLQVLPNGTLLVRAPLRMTDQEIQRFVEQKSRWIETHREKAIKNAALGESEPLDEEAIRALAEQACLDLPQRVRRFAPVMGVTYGKITVRNQTSRWGSCSADGNLNFNCLLMLAPPEVRDYVVVHELAHRKQMNHAPAFWREVASVLPDYAQQKDWLRQNGGGLIARMRAGGKP